MGVGKTRPFELLVIPLLHLFEKGSQLSESTKSNVKPWLYRPNWQGTRCEALTRRGTLFQRPGTKQNGRCRFHGGRSTCSRTEDGTARIAASKTTQGRTTKAERAKAKHRAEIGCQVRTELKYIEQWAVDQGHLTKDWRVQFK